MRTDKTKCVLITIMLAALALLSSPGQADSQGSRGRTWLAGGTVTKVDSHGLNMLGQNNLAYTVDTSRAEVVFESQAGREGGPRVGDRIRVYGIATGTNRVRAIRLRVLRQESAASVGSMEPGAPASEIKVIVEREPAEETRPPATNQDSAETEACKWQGRGLITDIDYTGIKIKVRTSGGQYTINAGSARIANGRRAIGLGLLNLGDAISITGREIAPYEVDANRVTVTRTRTESENALPQRPVSVAGVILQIDYPSMTFSMNTHAQSIVVSCDANSIVQSEMHRKCFGDLRPGMRVKMSGHGSLGTGYVAQHIQVISISP